MGGSPGPQASQTVGEPRATRGGREFNVQRSPQASGPLGTPLKTLALSCVFCASSEDTFTGALAKRGQIRPSGDQ